MIIGIGVVVKIDKIKKLNSLIVKIPKEYYP